MTPKPVYANPSTLAAPVAAFSHVSRVGDLIHLAGQTGRRRDGTMPDGVAAQAEQAFENIRLALESQGTGLDHVLKFTIYLTDRAHIGEYESVAQRVLQQHSPGGYPPGTLLIVAGLAGESMRIEIDAVAVA